MNGNMNGENGAAKECVLLTGGAGYIGSHTAIELIKAGYEVVILDNLHNSHMESVYIVEDLAGVPRGSIPRYEVDINDTPNMRKVFQQHKFDHVIHFAGLKAVGESCEKPLLYYRNNIEGTINLIEVMKEFDVHNLVFSSSATVYGVPKYLPLDETHPSGGCTNPYGRTKYMIEEILSDVSKSDERWNFVSLRYFNPVGAHESGKIGEDPQGIPNNLMPYITQVAVDRRPFLQVFGSDYDTPDGSGVRDYIHVVDLAIGHVTALSKIKENCRYKVYNLGTGTGYSVLDMVKAFEKAAGKEIPYKIVGRRSGDVASVYANPILAEEELGWKATRGLDKMCRDAWRWQSMNPNGFLFPKQDKSS